MGFRTTFGFKFRNPLIHKNYGMNASIISGSVLNSPSKISSRNFFTS